MFYLILLGLTFFMQLLAASWFDLAKKTGDEKKAFKHKMICSGIYMADILLCAAINNSFNDTYTLLLTVSFFMFFISDVIEERKGKVLYSLFNFFRFFAFIVSSAALATKGSLLFGTTTVSIKFNLIIALVFSLVGIVLYTIKKNRLPCFISSAYLLINSFLTGVPLHQSGEPQMQAASCAVIMGGVALALSSFIFVFDKEEKKSLYQINLYYFGLMFIACSAAVL